jgi:prepilin-type processing-associated H-X9-DG protein
MLSNNWAFAMSKVRAPSEIILLGDCQPTGVEYVLIPENLSQNWGVWGAVGASGTWGPGANAEISKTFRHPGSSSNMAFVDGHVAAQKLADIACPKGQTLDTPWAWFNW